MKTSKIGLAAAVILGFSSVAMQPASANDITNIINRLGGLNGTGSGQFAGNQAMIQSNIQTGMSNIQAQLSVGVNSGQLTLDEQAAIRAEMSRVQGLNSSFLADGGYTTSEVNQILSAFTGLNNLISSSMSNGSNIAGNGGFGYGNGYHDHHDHGYGNGNGNGWGNGYGNGSGMTFNSVVSLQNSVRARINAGVASGELTRFEANQLRSEYARIASQLTRRSLRGNLNVNPSVRRLQSLDARVTQMIDDNRYANSDSWYD